MSATNIFATDILALFFTNTNLAGVGDLVGLRGSASPGLFFISLHTSDPGEGGNQSTSETAYTGYSRISVARSSSGWTVSDGAATNASAVLFGLCTAAPGATITHFGIGAAAAGDGALNLTGALKAPYTPAISSAPNFPVGQISVTVD